MSPRRYAILSVAALSLSALTACGGDSSTAPKQNDLTPQEVQMVAADIFQQIAQAFANAGGFDRASLEAAHANRASSNLASAVGATETISVSAPCTLGGTVSMTGSATDNTNSQGTGSATANGSFTLKDCVVSTGQRNITVNGNPAITWSFAMNFVSFAQSGNATMTVGGGFKWTGGGSCNMNYTVTVDPQSHVAIRGSVCGVSVDGNYDRQLGAKLFEP